VLTVADATSPGPLRIGVIGLGIAGSAMIPAIVAHPNFLLAAVADPNQDLRERFANDHVCATVASAAELVDRADIDAVYVATPHQMHREHVLLAADHGKHAIVEKPMALTLADCDDMIGAARRNRAALIVGHTHSFDPAVKGMRQILDSGEVGRPALIAMWQYCDFLYRPRRPEELDTELGGGIIFNQIPHQVDIARLLNGSKVTAVRAFTAILDSRRRTEGICSALLTFADGGCASLVYNGYDRFDSDEFHGWVGELGQPKQADQHGATLRALESMRDGPESDARIKRYGYGGALKFVADQGHRWHQPHFGVIIVSCEKADLKPSTDGIMIYGQEGVLEVPVPHSAGAPGRAEVLDELYLAVRKGVAPRHDGDFGRATLEVCLAILESARTRREIELTAEPNASALVADFG
jgi:phthalate 4,5-cis-dihydrodiol dehydrogenase